MMQLKIRQKQKGMKRLEDESACFCSSSTHFYLLQFFIIFLIQSRKPGNNQKTQKAKHLKHCD